MARPPTFVDKAFLQSFLDVPKNIYSWNVSGDISESAQSVFLLLAVLQSFWVEDVSYAQWSISAEIFLVKFFFQVPKVRFLARYNLTALHSPRISILRPKICIERLAFLRAGFKYAFWTPKSDVS